MDQFVLFVLLGFGIGAVYALAAQGLIVIYRGSGVLNFSLGAAGMAGAFVTWDVNANAHVAYVPAFMMGVAVSALIGALTHLLVMRPLRTASPLARIVGTLGVLILVQSIVVLRYGSSTIIVNSALPTTVLHLWGSVSVSLDRLILLGIGATTTLVLWAVYRYSRFGVSTMAVAQNQRSAAALGVSPDVVATLNWTLGSALAGAAAILVSPIVQLQATTMTNLVLAAMAAALVAGFTSFPVAFGAGMAVGVLQSLLTRYVSTPGIAQSAPFLVIVVVMVLRGQALPLRNHLLQKLPSVGQGRVRPWLVALCTAVAVVLIATLPSTWTDSLTLTFSTAVVLLSIVVLTGYAGQISLAQYAVAGMGAYVSGRLAATQGVPFLPAALIAVVAGVLLGAAMALPAVRTRGINLAIVTYGLGSAIELAVFDNANLVGGFGGTNVPPPKLFGLNINDLVHQQRYAYVCLGGLLLVGLIVASVRRGTSGRRMLAVRTNERAAAALGINVVSVKLYAFSLSAGIASFGGVLIAFQSPSILYSTFANQTSILYLGFAMIGGIGFLAGPIWGAMFAAGTIGAQIGNSLFPNYGNYVQLVGGVVIVLTILANQDGIAHEQARQARALLGKLGAVPQLEGILQALRRPSRLTEQLRADNPGGHRPRQSTDHTTSPDRSMRGMLEVKGLVVTYGGVIAVGGVDLLIKPGEILGLIGPNGAGKTTIIDALTGFTRPAAGVIELGGESIAGWSVDRRARAGISRSFQSLELFEDLTVLDNLRAASDPRSRWTYLRDLAFSRNPPLPDEVLEAIYAFNLGPTLDRRVQDLPYGDRRLLSIARAVASNPSVLLLDEPAAGLSQTESREFAALVRRFADHWGIGVLLVEHDMEFVMSVCDRIAVIDFGRPVMQGTPVEVRTDPRVISAYLGEPTADDRMPVSATEAAG